MISFMADYLVGGHPAILQRLAETNMEMIRRMMSIPIWMSSQLPDIPEQRRSKRIYIHGRGI